MTALVVEKQLIVDNYNAIKKETGVLVIPVLKGNAYGIGEKEMAHLLFDAGCRNFAASRLEEALTLKKEVPEAEVLLLSPYSSEEAAEKIVEANITATVGSYDSGVLLNGIAQKKGIKTPVHFAFDTGMGRFGFLPEDADKAVQAAKFLSNLELKGCFTHLSNCFGKNKKDVHAQFESFSLCLQTLTDAGINPGIKHIANSHCAVSYPEMRLDAVRIGSALLGRVGAPKKVGLKKVGYLESTVCETRWLPANHNIGYANTFKTKKATRIAVVPVGYADGLFTEKTRDTFRYIDHLRYGYHNFLSLFGRGKLFCTVCGKKVPILGRVGLCTVEIDITNIDCSAGDTVRFEINPLFVNANVERKYI